MLQCLAAASGAGGGGRSSDVVAVDVTSVGVSDVTWLLLLLLLLQMVAQILLNAGVVVRTQDFENRTVAARMPAIKSNVFDINRMN